MNRRRKPSTAGDFLTGDLFSIPSPAVQADGAMDYRKTVSTLVGEILNDARQAGLGRHEVADRASQLAGRNVSKAMLDGYTAESRDEFNLPLWVAPVIESVCDSLRLTEWLTEVRGGRFYAGAATLDAEIGRRTREMDIAAIELKRLRELRRRIQ